MTTARSARAADHRRRRGLSDGTLTRAPCCCASAASRQRAMLLAVAESEQTKVELLLTHGCPTRPMSSLLRAVAGGHLDAARRLAADSALHLLPCRTKPTRCARFVLGRASATSTPTPRAWMGALVEAASRLKSGVAAAESDWLLATGAEPLARVERGATACQVRRHGAHAAAVGARLRRWCARR